MVPAHKPPSIQETIDAATFFRDVLRPVFGSNDGVQEYLTGVSV